MTSPERRNYFRINIELKLKCLGVSAHTVENSLPEDLFPEDQFSSHLIQELQRLDHEAQPHLQALSELNRALGESLKLLNRKIDLVAQHSASLLSNLENGEDRTQIPILVNVSEGGLVFPSKTPFSAGDYIALRLQFSNQYTPLTSFAVVHRCTPDEQPGSYTVACEFHQISQKAQDILRKHIMQEQLKAIRQQKQTSQHPI